MNKLFVLLLVSAFLVVPPASSSPTTAINNPTATPTPKSTAEIQSVELYKDEVIIPCPPGKYPHDCRSSSCDDDMSVQIVTTAKNPQKAEIYYNYTISGGRIVGQGSIVSWDLKGVREGTYTLTVQVGDGVSFSDKTITKTIKVRECDCCYTPCRVCPTVVVSGGGTINPATP